MGTLPAPGLDQLEEHLLVCCKCRQRLDEAEQYAGAIRAAAAIITERGTAE